MRWTFVWVLAAAAACAQSSGFTGGAAPAADAGIPGDPAGVAVYVATDGYDDADGTTPATAMRSIKAAAKRAKVCAGAPCIVKIAAGTYLESVSLYAGVHLYGGYARDFASRDAQNNVVKIVSSDVRAVIADQLDMQTIVDGVTIVGADLASGRTGKSSYALWVSTSRAFLVLSHVNVIGGRGEAGVAGAAGGAGSCTATGGPGGSAADCSSATGGDGNAGGDP